MEYWVHEIGEWRQSLASTAVCSLQASKVYRSYIIRYWNMNEWEHSFQAIAMTVHTFVPGCWLLVDHPCLAQGLPCICREQNNTYFDPIQHHYLNPKSHVPMTQCTFLLSILIWKYLGWHFPQSFYKPTQTKAVKRTLFVSGSRLEGGDCFQRQRKQNAYFRVFADLECR